MPKLSKKTFIGIKTETTQGTSIDSSFGATDYILAMDVEIKPVIELNERDYFRTSLDRLAHVVGKKYSTVKFKTEVKGSGTAGTAYAPLGAALMACGFTETVSASTSVTYTPTSTPASGSYYGPGKSCTITVYKDGIKHICAGSMGTVKFSFEAGKIAFAEFDFQGLYTAASVASNPTTTFLATLPPIISAATMTLNGDSSNHIAGKMEVDVSNSIAQRDDVNSSGGLLGFMITGRSPKGSIDPEAQTSDDVWDDFILGTSGSSDMVVGATGGNIITFTMPKTQYSDVSYADRSGILVYNANLVFNQNTGDDWITIVFT